MADPVSQPPATLLPLFGDRLLLWGLLATCWLGMGLFAWFRLVPHPPPPYPGPQAEAAGRYDTVAEITGPASLRLARTGEVRLGGVAAPSDADASGRARARLSELAPPGATVYVELEAPGADADGGPPAASVYLPPPGAGEPEPFPYGDARLLGAVMLQEGWLARDAGRPYRYGEEFSTLEDDARRHARGLWAKAE